MEYFAPLFTIFVVSLLGWLTPGPNMIAVISASMANGRQIGLATGLGLGLAATLWTLLAVFGVTALFELFPWIARLVKIFGACYLIWLGYGSIRNSQTALAPSGMDAPKHQRRLTPFSAFTRGLMVSMTNPKAVLFYGSILSAVVPPNSSFGFLIVVVLFSGGLAAIFHSFTALIFSTNKAMTFFVKSRQNIEKLFGFIFIGIGGVIFYEAWKR